MAGERFFVSAPNNNIDTISYYETNQTDTDLLVFQYTYSDFDSSVELNSALNPVYNYSFSTYDPLLGLALNLELSNQAPLKSSYFDGNGTYREENISAEILLVENDKLKELSYTDQGVPSNNYLLKFWY